MSLKNGPATWLAYHGLYCRLRCVVLPSADDPWMKTGYPLYKTATRFPSSRHPKTLS